jgi:hypothetical protein
LYADNCRTPIIGALRSASSIAAGAVSLGVSALTTFGEDAAGELYARVATAASTSWYAADEKGERSNVAAMRRRNLSGRPSSRSLRWRVQRSSGSKSGASTPASGDSATTRDDATATTNNIPTSLKLTRVASGLDSPVALATP